MRSPIFRFIVALSTFTLGVTVHTASRVEVFSSFSAADTIECSETHRAAASSPPAFEFTKPNRGQVYFDPVGEYVFAHETPKGFENLYSIAITKNNFSDSHSGKITLLGGPALTHQNYRIKRLTLHGDQISFITMTIKGVSYRFTGRFLERGILDELYDSESSGVVLEGRLTKTLDERKIAESDVSFVWSLSGS